MGMMWTTENRPRYNRDKLRYPSDLTDEEWAHVEHLIPPAKRGGRRREIDEREVLNGLLYVLSTGCQWRYIPRDLPPRSTLFDYFQRWEYDGTLSPAIGESSLPRRISWCRTGPLLCGRCMKASMTAKCF